MHRFEIEVTAKSIHVKFFTFDQYVETSLRCIITKLKFLRLAVFKIFCQFFDKRLTFGKPVYIRRIASSFTVLNFFCFCFDYISA